MLNWLGSEATQQDTNSQFWKEKKNWNITVRPYMVHKKQQTCWMILIPVPSDFDQQISEHSQFYLQNTQPIPSDFDPRKPAAWKDCENPTALRLSKPIYSYLQFSQVSWRHHLPETTSGSNAEAMVQPRPDCSFRFLSFAPPVRIITQETKPDQPRNARNVQIKSWETKHELSI